VHAKHKLGISMHQESVVLALHVPSNRETCKWNN